MKKVFFIVSVFVLLGASSCKKDWTCTCGYTTGAGTPTVPNAVSYPISGSTKAQATTACNNDATALNGQGAADWSCSL